MASFRMKRVRELIKEILGECLIKIKDPRIGFVTITDVNVSPDLDLAKVFISTMGNEKERESSLSGLESASGFLRKEVGKQLRLKKTPRLVFQFDPGIERGSRIIKIINEVIPKTEEEI